MTKNIEMSVCSEKSGYSNSSSLENTDLDSSIDVRIDSTILQNVPQNRIISDCFP